MGRSFTLAAAASVALAGCVAADRPPPAAVSAAPSIEYVDLTDEFASFHEASQKLDPAQRVAAFKAYFEPIIPGFYDRDKVGPYDYNAFISTALAQFPQDRAGIEAVSRGFRAMAVPARASFERTFGPMGELPPIILLHSLGEMDGGVRSLESTGSTLLFGADMIAKIHLAHGIQPFVHHELFHVFHGQRFTGCGAVWCGLWSEGLAVYAAERLNPGATDAQLLLVNPVPLRPAVEADRRRALCGVIARLDSTDQGDLFTGQRRSGDIPARAGYYVGYLAAAEAGKTNSLQELAAMPAEEVRPLVEASLRKLADCAA